jgi:hypothetical protein
VAVVVRSALYNPPFSQPHSQTLAGFMEPDNTNSHAWTIFYRHVSSDEKKGRFTIPTLLKIQEIPFVAVETKYCELSMIIRGF